MKAGNRKRIRRKIGALVLSSVIALGAPEAARSAGQAPAEQGEGNGAAQQKQDGARNSPLHVLVVEDDQQAARRTQREEAARQNQQDAREAQHRSDRLATAQAGFGFATMLLLFITLFYTARTANAAKKSADQAGEALKHSVSAADAAVQSADVAERALATSVDQFTLDRRPWVAAKSVVNFLPNAQIGVLAAQRANLIHVHFEFSNIGRSPASDLEVQIDHVIIDNDEKPVWPEFYNEPGIKYVLAPGEIVDSNPVNITERDIEQILQQRRRLLVRIEIRYSDSISGIRGTTVSVVRMLAGAPFAQLIAGAPGGIRFMVADGSVME